MNRKIIGLIVVATVMGAPIAVKFSNFKPKLKADLVKVQAKQIYPTILASGNFVYRQEVQLSSEVIGKVSEVTVKEGNKIEKGQVLLRLDPSSYRAEVAQQEANKRSAEVAIERAQLNIENQQRTLERARSLMAAKFIDASKFDEALHQMDLAKFELRASHETLQQASAILSQSRERLAKTEVRAPISGTVTAVQIKIGETAVASTMGIAGSSLMTIADVGSMMAEVSVDEADVARVALAQSARVFPAAFPDKPVAAIVESVSLAPKVSSQGRSYVVKLRLLDSVLTLRTGMTCRVEIITGGGGSGPVLPIQAVQAMTAYSGAKITHFVYAVVDGVVRKKIVEVGIADDTNQEILKGLAVGEVVIAGPARTLRDIHEGDNVTSLKPKDMPVKLAEGTSL
jgi:HlyD family secretion protein